MYNWKIQCIYVSWLVHTYCVCWQWWKANYRIKSCSYSFYKYNKVSRQINSIAFVSFISEWQTISIQYCLFCNSQFNYFMTESNVRFVTLLNKVSSIQCCWLFPHYCSQILEMVRKKERPATPEGTPEGLHHLISLCWDHNPAKRPQFKVSVSEMNTVNRFSVLDFETLFLPPSVFLDVVYGQVN